MPRATSETLKVVFQSTSVVTDPPFVEVAPAAFGSIVVVAPSAKVKAEQHPDHSGAAQVTADWLVVNLKPVKYISFGLSVKGEA